MALGSFLKNRAFKFEVHLYREDRWTIETILDQEEEATRVARKLLGKNGSEEVKIIRYKDAKKGRSFESEIFHEKQTRPTEAPLSLGEVPKKIDPCQTLEDCFSFDATLLMSRLFRMFLVRNTVTMHEVMYNGKLIQKLDDAGGMLNAAIFKIAAVQAPALEQTQRQRAAVLDGILGQATARARELAADRKRMPKADGGDLNALSATIKARFDAADHDHVFMTVLGQRFFGMTAVAGRLEALLAEIDDGLDDSLLRLVEPIIAECLDFADVVQELFGPHPNLAGFLCMLIDLLNGRLDLELSHLDKNLVRIARLMKSDRAPHCREVLLGRLENELNGRKALNRRSPDKEKRCFDQVMLHLGQGGSDLTMRPGIRTGISHRKKSFRQQELRKLGLHDAADAL